MPAPPRPITSAAVLGAGLMGARIAAHLANAGVRVRLLDLTDDLARASLDRLTRVTPAPLFVPGAARLITAGRLDDLAPLSDCDWILEAVVEDLDTKRALLARVDAVRSPGAIVSSNTSGLPLGEIARDSSPGFRAHWLGTHFFNPPRYLHLVELIPIAETDPAVTARMHWFLDHALGKGVVVARDSPGFIANRLGVFGAARLLEAAASGRYTIEEIDAITGPALGRPKSATFRTMDIAGVDILARVAADLDRAFAPGTTDLGPSTKHLGPSTKPFALPPLVARMLERGLLGDKTGGGFYKKEGRGADARILTLDLESLTYRDRRPAPFPALDEALAIEDVGARIRALFSRDDRVGALLRETLGATLEYASRVAPAIAHSKDDVDRAMRWGFGWALGPFETWDAIGLEPRQRAAPLTPAAPDLLILQSAKARAGIVAGNAGASLVDLGDGVLAVEFHSKMNTIAGDAIAMLHAGVAEAERNFAALVIGSEAEHFSAGANLMLLLLEAQDGNWDDVDAMVRAFQGATAALKFARVPVVAAPAGLALGGGCEICLHADRLQAAAETYIGLVETGVGLIPAGGGTKEMLLRANAMAAGLDRAPFVQRAFETMALGKVSTSAADARRLGYLQPADRVTMNRERVMWDAKALALDRVREGYQPPLLDAAIPVGGASLYATLALGVHLAWRAGQIGEHDALVGRTLARVLTGGDLPHASTISESHLLDLEREAFLRLCGEPKTIARIARALN